MHNLLAVSEPKINENVETEKEKIILFSSCCDAGHLTDLWSAGGFPQVCCPGLDVSPAIFFVYRSLLCQVVTSKAAGGLEWEC